MDKGLLLSEINKLAADYAAGLINLKDFYNGISVKCMEHLDFREFPEGKTCSYLSMEFLMGRMVDNNMLALGILKDVRDIFQKHGISDFCFEDVDDYALGNGGLGRLAACFLDSAATLGLNMHGYGIRYKYGLFKQVFEDGAQTEDKDDWMRFGDPWSIRKDDDSVRIDFKDGRVTAVPYDMPVIGFGDGKINILRLWQSEGIGGGNDFNISDVLYPDDSDRNGKLLRLRQQYFFAGASIKSIVRNFVSKHGSDFRKFHEENIIQLNDTHPVIAVVEFIRILVYEYGYSFKNALGITKRIFNYTNHTIMPEALENWDTELFREILPVHLKLIRKINKALKKDLRLKGIGGSDRKNLMILSDGKVHMARLAIYASSHVNGVAAIHTDILRESTFSGWWKIFPGKLQNKTNGITQRRWLGLCNTELTDMINRLIGDGFLTDLDELKKLDEYVDDAFIEEFMKIKHVKKAQLAEFIQKKQGIGLDPDMVYDIQIKRIHEYKRQLLNIFSILYIYYMMKDGKLVDFKPTAFIFGGKSAAGYARAKAIIKFINRVASVICNDDEVKDRLKIIFVEDYNVSYGEKLFPAADVSVQISTAGTEASGTGNMKFMLNGAVTLGTYDGANIEIVEEAGIENNYIFGARVEEINDIKDKYDPKKIINERPMVKKVVETLIDGFVEDDDGSFRELYDAITKGTSWHAPDHYFLIHDLESFVDARLRINRDQKDEKTFARKCINNMINAGKFSSDRTITEYNNDIWHLTD